MYFQKIKEMFRQLLLSGFLTFTLKSTIHIKREEIMGSYKLLLQFELLIKEFC